MGPEELVRFVALNEDFHAGLLELAKSPVLARQLELQRALFAAYFTAGRNPSDREVLVDVATQAGLDPVRAREILESGRYADEVRERDEASVAD